MRSVRQLGFFVRRKHRHFYVLYPEKNVPPLALSIWTRRGGFLVCREDRRGQCFLSYATCETGALGDAIREGRLYVL